MSKAFSLALQCFGVQSENSFNVVTRRLDSGATLKDYLIIWSATQSSQILNPPTHPRRPNQLHWISSWFCEGEKKTHLSILSPIHPHLFFSPLFFTSPCFKDEGRGKEFHAVVIQLLHYKLPTLLHLLHSSFSLSPSLSLCYLSLFCPLPPPTPHPLLCVCLFRLGQD